MFNSSAKLSLALAEGMPELCSVPHARPLQPPSLRLPSFPISQQITPDYYCCVSGRRSEEHTSELQSRLHLVCRLLLEKKKKHQALCLARAAARPQRRFLLPDRSLLARYTAGDPISTTLPHCRREAVRFHTALSDRAYA